MKKVLYFFKNKVIYRYSYDTEISIGNTSTGTLQTDFLGDAEQEIRELTDAGYLVYPVVLLGTDLLGQICMQYLQQLGCRMDYVGRDMGKTEFVFLLEESGGGQTTYEYINRESRSRSSEYKAYCLELLRGWAHDTVFAAEMAEIGKMAKTEPMKGTIRRE